MKCKHPAPAVVLHGGIAALALVRRLGRAGVACAVADDNADAPAFASRFCRRKLRLPAADDAWLETVLRAGRELGGRPVLLPTSDEFVLWASRCRGDLEGTFRLLLPESELLDSLLDKRRMAMLAAAHGVATPRQRVVGGAAEATAAGCEMGFPCLVKSAVSHPGGDVAEAGKLRVSDAAELERAYRALAALDGRVLVQEYLAGGCEHVALYNAYFDRESRVRACFTGRKLRQYPLDYGTACLSECRPMAGVAVPLTRFFRDIGYRGPVDVGLKYDPRGGCYKVLDINPRLGQNFACFRGHGGVDLGWLAYADLAGLAAPRACLTNGRRTVWLIEDDDWRACRQLHARGELSRWAWARSWLRARRGAFWDWRDPAPFWRRLAAPLRRRWSKPAPAVRPAASPSN